MVLIVELLLAVAILAGVYRLATSTGDRLSEVEPDRAPTANPDGPLTADELVALRIPAGVGYRKADVDRLLDRIARQLPRDDVPTESDGVTGFGLPGTGPFAGEARRRPGAADTQVSLEKEPDHG